MCFHLMTLGFNYSHSLTSKANIEKLQLVLTFNIRKLQPLSKANKIKEVHTNLLN